MSNLANIAIGLIVVGLLLARQLQPRPAKETSSIRLVLILGVAGIAEISRTIGSRLAMHPFGRPLPASEVDQMLLLGLFVCERASSHPSSQGLAPTGLPGYTHWNLSAPSPSGG